MPIPFDPSEFPDLHSAFDSGMLWETLVRYVSGEANADESNQVDRWRYGHADRTAILQHLTLAWQARLPDDEWAPDLDAMQRVVMAAIQTKDQSLEGALASRPRMLPLASKIRGVLGPRALPRGLSHSSGERHGHTRQPGLPFRRGLRAVWLTAPMIGIALIGGLFGWRALAPNMRTFLSSAPASSAPMRYVTARGQRTIVRLPDGSTVLLNAASRIDLPTDFSSDHRTVELVGEGLFTVAHVGRTPFTVIAGATQTRVLGTTFDVRHYTTDTQTRIVVVTGKVAVQPVRGLQVTNISHVLTAMDVAVVSDSGDVKLIPRVDVDDYTAWTDGRLVFRGTPLRDVVLELGRAYNVDIAIADSSLAGRRVTLTAATTVRSLTAILDAIAPIVDAHYTRDGHVITFRRGHTVDTTRRTIIFPSLETQYGR